MLQFGVFPPPHGGVQSNIVAIRDYVRRIGIRCGVVNLTRHRRADSGDVFYPKTPFGVVSRMVRFPAQILHFHLGGKIMPRLLALYLLGSMLRGKKTVLTFHSGGYPDTPEGQAATSSGFAAFVFRRMDRIIAVNQAIQDLFRRFGVPAGRIRLIPPYSIPAEQGSPEMPPNLQHFLDARHPLLLTVGLLEPEYDLPLQIEALGRILDRHPTAGLLIAGAGSLHSQLEALIASKPYASNILLYGDMPHSLTLHLLRACGILLRTTLYDGDSVAVREALHFGTPVIASDNGMRPAGVKLIPKQDIEALQTAIETQLQQGRECTAGKPAGEENLEAVLQLYRELYRELSLSSEQ
ncbi:MAG: glycosyltransferase [Acidobacteriota bacterium]|nr:glycosyltransferase [Acidobacteriota bacterium]